LAVAFGCAAYQAGNLLGAVSGLLLVQPNGKAIMLGLVGLVAGMMLWQGKYRSIANLLGMVVALMGILFIIVAFSSNVAPLDVVSAMFIPSWNPESSLLIIGLIGTTIVPYNLFLASGISQGQDIREMRVGLISAIVIGGLISIGILIAGTQVAGDFSFERLASSLSYSLGPWASYFFAFGLFAAGLTSSITAPLAAAVTARSLFGQQKKEWLPRSRNFRLVWGVVILVGLLFSLTNIKPIPAIIAAQAINGVLLPVVAGFLILTVNDKKLLSSEYLNSPLINVLMLLVLTVCCFLGINNVLKALQQIGLFAAMTVNTAYLLVASLTLLIVGIISWQIISMRKTAK
jgi:Mn2+/Fe2+ NRAMP family transporter